jgi:hypothetical protein
MNEPNCEVIGVFTRGECAYAMLAATADNGDIAFVTVGSPLITKFGGHLAKMEPGTRAKFTLVWMEADE